MSDPAGAFWDYSLALYGRPGVADVLIALQDGHGADVNVMLYCCWRAASGGGFLDDAALAALDGSAADWRATVVLPLRALRRGMKSPVDGVADDAREGLRAEVKRLELETERVEQRLIVAAGETIPVSESSGAARADARRSLETCLIRSGSTIDAALRESLDRLLDAAFDPTSKMPDSSPDVVTSRARWE